MDFREEYKKSAEVMTPSAEAMERMTRNIMEQVNAPVKKAIPFRKISYIGGAVAACAVITLGAVKLLPALGNSLDTAPADNAGNAVQVAYEENVQADGDRAFELMCDGANGIVAGDAADEDVFTYAESAADTTSTPMTTQVANAEKSVANIDIAEDICEDVPEDVSGGIPVDAAAGADAVTEFVSESEKADCTTELIYVAADGERISVSGRDYIRIERGASLPDERAAAVYMGTDGMEYRVTDYGNITAVELVTEDGTYELLGIYCPVDRCPEELLPESLESAAE